MSCLACLLPTRPETSQPHLNLQKWLVNRHGVLQTKDRVPPRLTSSPKNKHGLVLIISEQLSLGLSACLVQTGTFLCRNNSATIRSWDLAFTKAARLFPQVCVCKSVIVIAMLQRLQACCPRNRSHRSTDALGSSPRLELPIRSLPEPVSEQGTKGHETQENLRVKFAQSVRPLLNIA